MVSHCTRVSRRGDAATMSIHPARARCESKDEHRMLSGSRATPRAVDRAAQRRYPSSTPARFRGEKNQPAKSLGVSFNRGTHPSFATGATTAARALTVLRAAETLAPARKRH